MTDNRSLVLANLTSVTTSSFRERVEVAARAGFDGLGFGLERYREALASGLSKKDLRAIADDNGVRIVELEGIIGFAVDPAMTGSPLESGLRYTPASELDELWDMADVFDAGHLSVSGAFHTADLESDAVERFATLCDQAAQHNLKVALEFCPVSNVPDAAVATKIAVEAGRANGGLCVDSWHHVRGANDLGMLRAIPGSNIITIQFNDGLKDPADPNFFVETMSLRQVPGTAEFDLNGFLNAVLSTGTDAPLSVEVMSGALAELPAADAASQLISGARSLLAEAS